MYSTKDPCPLCGQDPWPAEYGVVVSWPCRTVLRDLKLESGIQCRLNQAEAGLESTRSAYYKLCTGIKAALGLENWPEIHGDFVAGVVALVDMAVSQGQRTIHELEEMVSQVESERNERGRQYHDLMQSRNALNVACQEREAIIKGLVDEIHELGRLEPKTLKDWADGKLT